MSKKAKNAFEKDYMKITKGLSHIISHEKEWLKKGDFFHKFSLYENYTPVKTSGETTLVNDI